MLSLIFKGVLWLAKDDEEKVVDVQNIVTDINTYENIAGALILSKVLRFTSISNDKFETLYRVQGGGSKIRFIVEPKSISIAGDDMLFINIGQEGRALEFFAKRGNEAVLVKFKINKSFIEKIRRISVPQNVGRQFPGRPQTVDATKAIDQFGIPKEYFNELLKNIDQNTIEVIEKKK